MKTYLFVLFCYTLLCSQKELSQLSFLEGIWKVDGKEKYEEWKFNSKFEAAIYKIKNTKKIIQEDAKIEQVDGKIIYYATVRNQNAGNTIPFSLISKNKKRYIFENKTHDFPNKIVYQVLSSNRLQIEVLNNKDLGFTYYMTKQTTQSMKLRNIVLNMFKAFNNHNWKKHVSYNSPNIIIRNPDSKMKPTTPSREKQIKNYSDLATWCPNIQDKIVSLNIYENKAIVEFEAYGTTVENKPFKLPIITVLEFKNDLVIKETTYYSE